MADCLRLIRPFDGRRTRALRAFTQCALLSLLLGCSEDPTVEAKNVEKFLGTWAYTDGLWIAQCGGAQFSYKMAGIEIGIARGSKSDLELSTGSSCLLRLALEEGVARMRSEQDCKVRVEASTSRGHFREYELKMTDAETLTCSASGTSILDTQGVSIDCPSFTMSSTLKKRPELEARRNGPEASARAM